jgi:DNA-directed RNA polymerase subunit RPC12/RpoP
MCANCQDIVSLIKKPRFCDCGKCGGRYIDKLNAEVWGDDLIIIGFDNRSFVNAIFLAQNYNKYENFRTFLISPTTTRTIKKVSLEQSRE